jgi:hypothetical protein
MARRSRTCTARRTEPPGSSSQARTKFAPVTASGEELWSEAVMFDVWPP